VIKYPEQISNTASLIKETFGENVAILSPCIGKVILCPRNNDVDLINEEVRISLGEQIKTLYALRTANVKEDISQMSLTSYRT
jgi:hypothetical protein